MGSKIITEEDFWICTEGAIPTQFQGTRESLHDSNNHKYITVEDKATVGWLDFGCKKQMLLMALIVAVAVVAAVAIGILTVATGGLGLVLLGAVAGLIGGGIGAVIGGLICGQKMAPGREWNDSKIDFKIQGTKAITGEHTITCKAGGTVQYAPNIKSWLGALGYATLSYSSELVKCAFVGAAVGTVGSVLGIGSVTGTGSSTLASSMGWSRGLSALSRVSSSGGTLGTGINISRAASQIAWPGFRSIGGNIAASFGIGTGGTGAAIALGSRGIFGAESAAHTFAIDEVDKNGNPVSVLDSGLKGALPEYELGSRLREQGVSGLRPSDAMFLLYLLHLKTDPKGTYRDSNGKLRNARGNPEGKPPGTIAQDPRVNSSGNRIGKAYEDSRPSYRSGVDEAVFNEAKGIDGKVYDPVPNGKEIIWKPGDPRQGNWVMGHKPHYEYRHLYRAYMEGRITKEQFLDYFNDPQYYRPETPETSSSGKHESDESWYPFDRNN